MAMGVLGTSFLLLLLVAAATSLQTSSSPPITIHPPPPTEHRCIHDEVFDLKSIVTKWQRYAQRDGTMAPIRLIIDTTYLDNDPSGRTCTSVGQQVQTNDGMYSCVQADLLTSSVRSYIKSLLTEALSLWEDTLLVVPVSGQLRLNGGNQGIYGGVVINSTYTSGVTADTVIFATARPIVSNGAYTSTLAVATVLQQDQQGRPICGQLNINIGGMNTQTAMYPQNLGVVLHEMTHSLGFNYNLISDLTQQISLNVAAQDAATTRYVVTSPKVQAWAREYYDCAQMQGVELENQGGSGTAFSHWEKRVANNEYMTGTASRNPVFSDLTLSLLEDTGWYGVNYSRSGQLLWGQGMGCDFALRSCPNWPENEGYFCTNNGKRGCTADYQAKGVCQISQATNVPVAYQYFEDAGEVGTYDLPDYCPLTWGYENGWCFDTSQGTSSLVNQGEQYGESSRCYDSSLLKDLPVGGQTNQVCYNSACTAPDELRVKVGSYWYLCPPGGKISVIGYGGQLSCPDRVEQICAGSATDDTWPIYQTISPNAGGPGLKVTIAGRNFLAGTTVTIGDDELSDIVVVSSTAITATIPNSNTFKNPANLIERKTSVVVTDTKGRSAVGYNAFTVKVKFNAEFIKNALEYLADNWLITASLIAAIVVTCLICGYCCYRQKGKAEEAEEEYYD